MDWATRRGMLLGYRGPVFDKPNEGEGGSGEGSGDGGDGGEGDGVQVSGGLLDRAKSGEGDGTGEGDGQGEGLGNEGAGDKGDGRPQGLADKFWDEDKKEVRVDALMKAQSDAEKALGSLKRDKTKDVPEAADQYFPEGLDLGEDAPNMVLDGPDDPGLKNWGEVCHKYGLGKELATNLARDMMIMMNDHMPEIVDEDAEFEALGKNAEGQIDAARVWSEGLARDGKISKDDAAVIGDLAKTANGIRLINKFREMAGEQRVPTTDLTGAKQMSRSDWQDAYKEAVKEGDHKKQAKLDAISSEIFGDAPAHSGPVGGVNSDLTRHSRKT